MKYIYKLQGDQGDEERVKLNLIQLADRRRKKKKVRYTVFGNRGSNYRGSVTQNYSTRAEAKKAVERVSRRLRLIRI
jgi:hypothetical protein